MNNEKYLDELDGRLQVLNELRKRIIELSKAIIGDTLYNAPMLMRNLSWSNTKKQKSPAKIR